MFDRLAGLATHIYHLDIFMIFEREVPERVIGNERGIASAWFNLLLDEIAVRRQHQQAMAVHVTVLTSASTSRNDTCLLCVTFGGQTDPGEIMPDGGLSTRVSQRTRERANAADVSIESSLITIPVIATETAAPQLTGEVAILSPDPEEEQSLELRLERWGLRIVRNAQDAQVVLIGHREQRDIERVLKDINQSTAILLRSRELFTNVIMMAQPITDSQLFENCKRVLERQPRRHPTTPSPAQSARATSSPQVPMFDRALALARANHRPDLAEEFLDVFMDTIDDDQTGINRAFEREDLELLKRRIHKLNGATRFCGLPRLNRALSHLGKLAESGTREELDLAITLFNHEINELRNWYDPHQNLFGTSLTRTEVP